MTDLLQYMEDIDDNNVQHYCKHAKDLKKTQVSKAIKLLKMDCIRYVGDQNEYKERCSFICLPLNTDAIIKDEYTGKTFQKIPFIKDYNSTIYTITKHDDIFECNCQGWQSKARHDGISNGGVLCSHVLALFFAFKLNRFRGGFNLRYEGVQFLAQGGSICQ